MSTTETRPAEMVCSGGDDPPGVQVLAAREVPLGGPRAMTVRRTLPHRERSFVGAWCFVDHYGPDDVADTGGMDVPPHPHTGLQTVSWLFSGQIEHRDSGGVHAMVRPGEVNLMTGARGICHSEVSTPATSTLHGVQLWVALPEADRGLPRDFQHFAAPQVEAAPGARLRVFLGSLAGQTSPVRTQTALLGAQAVLAADTTWTVPVDPAHEHAVLVDSGEVSFCGEPVPAHALGIVGTGRGELTLHAATDARMLLLGGEPYEEQLVMWWNFIGRDHDEIVAMRTQWEGHSERFGEVSGYEGKTARLPAPALPGAALRARGRHGRA